MKPWERYQRQTSPQRGEPWKRYAPAPVTAEGLDFLGKREDIRAELHPRDLGQLDFGGDTPELRAAVGEARDRVDTRLQDGIRGDQDTARKLERRTTRLGRVAAGAAGVQNGVTLGMGDRINAGIDRADATIRGQNTEGRNFLDESRATRGELIEEHPIAYTVGEIGGFLAPGGLAFKAGSRGARAVGATSGASRLVPAGGSRLERGIRYGGRLAPLAVGGATDAALYGATSASANQEALTGESQSIDDRLRRGVSYAPFGALAAPAMSGLYRLGVRGRTGQFTPNAVLRENAERGIAAGGGDAKQLIIDSVQRGGDVSRGTARAVLSILDRSGLPRSDIARGATNAVKAVERGVELDGRAPIFSNALASEFPSSPQVADNLQNVLRQLQTPGPRQGNAPAIAKQGLDAQAQSQQQHLRNVFSRELGSENAFDERKALEAVHRHQADQGYSQALRAIDTTSHNPNPSAQHGFSQVEAISGLRETLKRAAGDRRYRSELEMIARRNGEQSVDDLIANKPQYAAHELQSSLRQSSEFADRSFGQNLLENLERTSLFVKRNGAHRELPSSEYAAARNQFRERSQQLESADIGEKLLTKVKDGARADDLLLQLRTLEPDSRRLAALSIKESLENVFRNTNSDEVIKNLSTLNQLRKVGLHEFLEDALGESGARIVRNIEQVLDERQFLAGAKPSRLGQKPNDKDLVDARRLYTANPLARFTEGISWRDAITADIGTSLVGVPLPTGSATGLKALGSAFGPSRRTREGLARLLTESRAAPAQPRARRVPAAEAPIPAGIYRDSQGRAQKGRATPAGQLPRDPSEGVLPPLSERQARPAPERPTGSPGTQPRAPIAEQAEQAVARARAVGSNANKETFTPQSNAPAEHARVRRNLEILEQKEKRLAAQQQAKVAKMESQTEMIINEADALAREARRNVKVSKKQRAQLERDARQLARMESKARQQKMKADVEQTIAKIKQAQRATRHAGRLDQLRMADAVVRRAFDIAAKATGIGAAFMLMHVMWRVGQLVNQSYDSTQRELVVP